MNRLFRWLLPIVALLVAVVIAVFVFAPKDIAALAGSNPEAFSVKTPSSPPPPTS
jgi:hypothetical protein